MSGEWKDSLTVIGFALILIAIVRLIIPYKIKRVIKRCEYVQNNLNNKNVRKLIRFIRINNVSSPQIGQALRETQLAVNEANHIDGDLKLSLYNTLSFKRIMGIQEVNPVYVDKDGNPIA